MKTIDVEASNPRVSTCMPNESHAVDVDVRVTVGDDVFDGEVTLLPGDYDKNSYKAWGVPGNWIDGRLLEILYTAADAGEIDFIGMLGVIESAASASAGVANFIGHLIDEES